MTTVLWLTLIENERRLGKKLTNHIMFHYCIDYGM